jgi:biotin carboxyl carrier protein
VKYVVTVNGDRLDLAHDADSVRIGDQVLRAHLTDVEGTPVKILTVGNEVHRVVVQGGTARGHYSLWIDGYRYDVEALDERTRAIRDLSVERGHPRGPAPVVAPMPGLIVRVNVEVGDNVRIGTPVVVIEAMKMENELRAPASGIVSAIRVEPGSTVERGAVLVELS